jgi:hypothetical protein
MIYFHFAVDGRSVHSSLSAARRLQMPRAPLTPLQVGSAAAVNSGDWTSYYSAVCWLTAAEIFDTQLQRSVPVGLVSSNWVIFHGALPFINRVRVSLLPGRVVHTFSHGHPPF